MLIGPPLLGAGASPGSDILDPREALNAPLLGFWPLDEASGHIARDLSPYAGHGTLVGGATRSVGPVDGGVTFDGSTGYISTSRAQSLDGGFSAVAWINLDAGAGTNRAILSSMHQFDITILWQISSGTTMQFWADTRVNNSSSSAFSDVRGQEVCLGVSWNRTRSTRFFVNGAYVGGGSTVGDVQTPITGWNLGRYGVPAVRYFNGSQRMVRVFGTALPDSAFQRFAANRRLGLMSPAEMLFTQARVDTVIPATRPGFFSPRLVRKHWFGHRVTPLSWFSPRFIDYPDAATAGVGVASGAGTVAGAGASIAAGTGAATGSSTVPAVGASVSSGAGAATGVGAAPGVGVAVVAAAGSAAGSGAASATGAATAAGAGAGAGAGASTGTGAATTASPGSAAGTGAAPGAGASTAASVGASTGAGAAAGAGGWITTGFGVSAGSGAADGAGAATAAGVGASVGAGDATGVGSVPGTAGFAAGVGAASGAGAAVSTASATGAGAATAAGVGAAAVAAAGVAAGAGTAAGTGAGTAAAAGAAAGAGSAAAASGTAVSGAGASAGAGDASGQGTGVRSASGAATGVGVAGAAGASQVAGAGAAAGTGTAPGVGASIYVATGGAGGFAVAFSAGRAVSVAVGAAAGASAAVGAGPPTYIPVGAQSLRLVGAAASLVSGDSRPTAVDVSFSPPGLTVAGMQIDGDDLIVWVRGARDVTYSVTGSVTPRRGSATSATRTYTGTGR